MANLFLDYVNGNDANSGNSFANRFQTITNGALSTRTAPGDVVRLMRSPNPTALGQSATFTNKSDTITLTSAVTANVSLCNAAWAALANVTTAAETTTYKQGTGSSSIVVAAGFTTGVAAYEAMASTDFSTYQQLSFWIRSDVNVVANRLSVRLCSDAAGATPVDTFTIPHNLVANRWYPVTIDKGSALGSAIQSVALYVDVDFGTVTLFIDNILACKSVASVDSLTLSSLIGKGTAGEYYFPIRSINGTTVKLDSNSNSVFSTTPRGYSGVTATVACSKRECIKAFPVDAGGTAWGDTQESGTSGNLITYSGGWNTTDMSTQDGETYIDFMTSQNNFLNATSNFLAIEKIVAVRAGLGFQSGADCTWSNVGVIGSGSIPLSLSNSRLTLTGDIFAIACGGTINLTGDNFSVVDVTALSTQSGAGVQLGTSSNGIVRHTGTVKANNCQSLGCGIGGSGDFNNFITSDNGASGFGTFGSLGKQYVQSLIANGNTGYAINLNPQTYLTINTFSSTGNTSGVVQFPGTNNSYLKLKNPVYTEGTFHTGTFINSSGAEIDVHNDNATGAHFTKTDGGITRSESGADRRTLSGIAWRLSPTSVFRSFNYPLRQRQSYVKLLNGVTRTFSVWVKRTNSSNISGRLICQKGQLAGMTTDQIANASAGSNIYEQLSISLTATEDGIVEVFCEAWGGTAESMYIDDPELT